MHPVEKFGEFVVTNLRDQAIDRADGLLAGRWKSPSTQALQSALAQLSPEQRELVRRVVVSSVDGGIHGFLFALDEANYLKKGIEIVVDGQNIVPLSDGLYGEPFTDKGWFARFSKHGSHPDPD